MPVTERMMIARKFTQWVTRTGTSQTYFSYRQLFPMASLLAHGDLHQRVSLGVKHVDRAGETRVEGMDGPENLQGLVRVRHRRSDQRRFVGPPQSFRVAGRGVP